MDMQYRSVGLEEMERSLFQHFERRQTVTKCWRKEDGRWVIRDAPFIDNWSEEDYGFLVHCLQNTIRTGGVVYGAFQGDQLKGFVSVESSPIGKNGDYLDLTSLHVSAALRGQGVGRQLFRLAAGWARTKKAKKLYISAHSAVETQAFYKAMGCREAAEYNPAHVEREPADCQLEFEL